MSIKNSVKAVPLATIASSTLGASYQQIGSVGLSHPCFLLRINNGGSTNITVSYDGVNDHEFVVANTTAELNFQSNAQPNTFIASIAQGTKVYVKGTAGTGTIALSGYYQP